MDDFAKALEKYDYQFEKGQVVKGTVSQHTSDGAYIDIGGKCPGFLPLREAALEQVLNIANVLPLGEESEFLIISGQDAEGQVTLSRRQLKLQQAWDNVMEKVDSGANVKMRVTGSNKGGVTGEVEGLRGFIPRSHLMEKDNLESLIGQLLSANFLEVDRERNKLVLSQRQLARAAAMTNLEVGQLILGKVVKIQPYGVFVDLNGVTGLLHIKQVSGTRIDDLNTLFKMGQEIPVMIAEIDGVKNRISLSTKVLENYPGEILDNMTEMMATAAERAEKARNKLTNEE
ncbi:MAG: S1 RNA-binding domain-containing protein [Gomphosphaeria aponina SAG 52.96 = DSM 107014]|uniref:S1 RNA-binding domain-containing protein n=1 Tax=Gomphosphaeria aponina SAG 52.96 = DSM 107014 TaxID=1521640 RepID=A0A941JVA2_9CHRO|nr:S1 RNA-binding domain-containing protein [Gomphosphaeria aponina SAG 52.96 = DSM 107014]